MKLLTVWDAQSVVLVIAGIAAGLKIVVDAVYGGKKLTMIVENQERAESDRATNQALNTKKLDTIHEATNGGLTALRDEIKAARAEIIELKKDLVREQEK